MTDSAHDQHADSPEEQMVTVKTVLPTSPVPPILKPASKPAGSAKYSTRVGKFMRHSRWPLIVGSLMLILAIVFSVAYNLGLLFKPASAPLIVTMVTSYSGQNPSQGLEAWRGAKLYIDFVNQQENGVDGHQITLQEKNDKTSGRDGSIAEGIAQSRSLLMLGPVYSSMVLQPDGKELYKDTPIPLITASVSYDALTTDNPFAFRLRTITSSQGKNSATYVYQVLNLKMASIISLKGDSAYGQPVANTFTTTFQSQGGHIAQNLQIAQNSENISATLVHDPGIIFLAMTDLQTAHNVIVDLRTHGVTAPILCSDAIDSDLFPTLFSPNQKDLTDGIYASAPVIYDSAPSSVTTAFQSLSSWTYLSVQYASDTFSSRSTLGDPQLFDRHTRTDYSGLQVTMTIQRKALAYLISHLLPLILLMLLVYASLFLPLKYLGDRLALTVSALLASAVLLLSINSELPDIGYVVSLDYIYYIFFILCLLCTVVPMFMEWLHEQDHKNATRNLNIGLHFTYVVVLIITIFYYLVTYSNRLTW